MRRHIEVATRRLLAEEEPANQKERERREIGTALILWALSIGALYNFGPVDERSPLGYLLSALGLLLAFSGLALRGSARRFHEQRQERLRAAVGEPGVASRND